MNNLRDELETTYRAERARLVRQLGWLFPSLNTDECEDLVQLAFMQALQELAKPEFVLRGPGAKGIDADRPDRDQSPLSSPVRWLPWLRTVSRYRAIDFLRHREEWSLDALLRNVPARSDSSSPAWQPADPALTPSSVLRQGEQAERRRVLVSDILAAYVQHVERYGMHVQREVFERSLRGQEPPDVAADMELSVQRVYEQRSKAFAWVRAEVQRRDTRGSILASVFGDRPAAGDSPQIPPRRLHDLIHLAVDQLGALCPSDRRLDEYRVHTRLTAPGYPRAGVEARRDAAPPTDIHYHIIEARWYLDDRPQQPGCRLCAARLEAET